MKDSDRFLVDFRGLEIVRTRNGRYEKFMEVGAWRYWNPKIEAVNELENAVVEFIARVNEIKNQAPSK